ncbi:unnamed protein product [Rotaria sp. Silwood1]|nr:unnamed protein product [Rotaria sp. Silwood1]
MIIDRIISLNLSDNDETSHLPVFFLSHGYTLDQFKYVQSLSLNSISSIGIINKIISQCRHLQHLTHLYIIKCYIYCDDKGKLLLMNNIWSISKLIYCYFDCFPSSNNAFIASTIISQSIEYLVMKNIKCDLNNLSYLFQCTPNLRRLHTTISCNSRQEELKNIFSSIISLKLIYLGSIDSMKYLFQNLKNLSSLTLETSGIYLNGYEWESFLTDALPQIKRFRFKMNFNFKHINNQEEEVDILINSFSTQYWIEIRQQYVQCDWISSATISDATIYTLPYAFEKFSYYDNTCSKSTCPNVVDFWSYDRVHTVKYVNNRLNLVKDSISFRGEFPNVYHLNLTFLFNNNILSVYPLLNQLTKLYISLNDQFDYSQLQHLLDRSAHLYSLGLSKLTNLRRELFQIRSTSIRRLELIEKNGSDSRFFNDKECIALVNSSLGRQCEVLVIDVENETVILDLTKNIVNLRTLITRCKNDRWNGKEFSSGFDELVLWLHDHLPSTCLINRDIKHPYDIRIWVDCKQQQDVH